MAGIYRLQGTVKHYDWGGTSFIPALLQTPNRENLPFAEYWLGTHSLGISRVELPGGNTAALTEYVSGLPYLLKVLDVKDMLSIQVHPSKETAGKEFARENAAGIALDSPQRNYKDDNHKPELMVALSDFWLLHGFKPPEELIYTLLNVAELRELLPIFNQSGYAGLYKYVMEMPQEEVNRLLMPLKENLAAVPPEIHPDKNDEDFWVARAMKTFGGSNIDRGIFSIYLFNLVYLEKGEGIFQAAGVPHAYLEGQNVEIMANSDNVLRGGLTTKHIDVKELLKHVKCEPTFPDILHAEEINGTGLGYKTPVPDFRLSVFVLADKQVASFSPVSAEIILVTGGTVELSCPGETLELKAGLPSALVLPGKTLNLEAVSNATVFRASVPVHRG